MKYLAILKDSLRESIDSKVFIVMLGLSGLVVLLIGSVSYKSVAVEDDLNRMTQLLSWGLSRQFKGMETPTLRIEDFQQTNDAPADEPWRADYRFHLVWEFPEQAGVKMPAEARKALVGQTRALLRQQFSYLNNIEVASSDTPNANAVSLLVTTHGSSVTHRGGWLHEPYVFFVVPAS